MATAIPFNFVHITRAEFDPSVGECFAGALLMNALHAELLNTLQNSRVCLLLLSTRKEKSLCHRQRWIELNSNKYQIYQITE